MYRIEKDTIGEVKVPESAYWGAQTQRALENFQISNIKMPISFIRALAYVKLGCLEVNYELGKIEKEYYDAIKKAINEIIEGKFDDQFPLDIFQTGSATSTNMNINEVISTRANEILTGKRNTKSPIHPNDHVNMGQSSNDVIPTAMNVSTYYETKYKLIPAIEELYNSIVEKAGTLKDIIKTGRTHLMDAMPISFEQEMSGWATQILYAKHRIEGTFVRLRELAIGGTAVGTGINTHPNFGKKVAEKLSKYLNLDFIEANNHFEAQSSRDAILELSGALKVLASSLIKITNDIRLMNSGPIAGFGEISLSELQPGSSIMPGKVNPVVPEAVRMVGIQVIANDLAISICNSSGEFQLNVALPVMIYNILYSIEILSRACILLSEKCIRDFVVNKEHIEELVYRNPIIATVLNPIIGYDKAAEVVKRALKEKRSVKDIAIEMGYISKEEADKIFDLKKLIKPE
ncbi:MAG: class II fumarate hydratase [candidate division WOR-3 bacterium]|nr:class II fumarate hydratase [candidate division WOR-3 bacterium]MCX7947430.1 class II fumarate hydratase [candidate division WOR-3 bacterium]MDW8150590.1 class II fumarate hydratase [candidate division WOR-3 bacterium]